MPVLAYLHQLFQANTCHTYIHIFRWKDCPLQRPRCHSPWDALAGAVVCVEILDRITIDGDRIRARCACRIDKNVGDVRANGRGVEACSAAVAGEQKAEPGRWRTTKYHPPR